LYLSSCNLIVHWDQYQSDVLTSALVAVARVPVLAQAVVAALRVPASGVGVTLMGACRALVHLHTVEAVESSMAREALTLVAARSVDTPRVGMAVVTLQPALALALVYVCRRQWNREG
jgi:hypothetical protein